VTDLNCRPKDYESRQSKRIQHLCGLQIDYFWCVSKCVSKSIIFTNRTFSTVPTSTCRSSTALHAVDLETAVKITADFSCALKRTVTAQMTHTLPTPPPQKQTPNKASNSLLAACFIRLCCLNSCATPNLV
jgi:hypothetical protein